MQLLVVKAGGTTTGFRRTETRCFAHILLNMFNASAHTYQGRRTRDTQNSCIQIVLTNTETRRVRWWYTWLTFHSFVLRMSISPAASRSYLHSQVHCVSTRVLKNSRNGATVREGNATTSKPGLVSFKIHRPRLCLQNRVLWELIHTNSFAIFGCRTPGVRSQVSLEARTTCTFWEHVRHMPCCPL